LTTDASTKTKTTKGLLMHTHNISHSNSVKNHKMAASFSPPSYFCPNIYQLFVFGKSSRKEQPTKNNWALWTLTLFQTYNFNYTRTNYLGSEIFFRIIQTASVQIKRTSGGPPLTHFPGRGARGFSLFEPPFLPCKRVRTSAV